MTKILLDRCDLQSHLTEQIGFLKASADAFDLGAEAEAKRLAIALRILLYDGGQSKSLLGQLEILDRDFFDSAEPVTPGNLVPHSGLVALKIGANGSEFVAMLDDLPSHRDTSFGDWWQAAVFVDPAGNQLSRNTLVRIVADQDGGAHVDPSLDAIYSALTKNNSLGWRTANGAPVKRSSAGHRPADSSRSIEDIRSVLYQEAPGRRRRSLFSRYDDAPSYARRDCPWDAEFSP